MSRAPVALHRSAKPHSDWLDIESLNDTTQGKIGSILFVSLGNLRFLLIFQRHNVLGSIPPLKTTAGEVGSFVLRGSFQQEK